MTYRWLDDLGQALEERNVPVQYVDGWQNRGRPSSTGQFNPTGLLCHHTASPAGTSDQSELNVILSGNSEAPGPISQLLIGRQFRGVYVVAAGRANHAGSGLAPWMGQGKTDGNACMIGTEVANSGVGEYWPDWQIDIYAQTQAALLSHYGFPLDNTLIHYTFAQPYYPGSKIDPAGPWKEQPNLPGYGAGTWDLDIWKNYIANFSNGSSPKPPTPGDDDVAFVGPALIQLKDGSGKCYLTDGKLMNYRYIETPADLNDIRWNLVEAGLWPNNDTPPTPIDNLKAFGIEIPF